MIPERTDTASSSPSCSGQDFLPLTPPHTSPFLALPAEIRNGIYGYAVKWPSLSRIFKEFELSQTEIHGNETTKAAPLCTFPKPHYASLTTPSILLLNRQISCEALTILYNESFIIDSPPPYIPQLAKPMDITEFISESTLQKLRFVILDMDLNYRPGVDIARAWLKTVECLLDVWFVALTLERLIVRVKYVEPDRSKGWTFGEAGHHRNVIGVLGRLRGFNEQVDVVFEDEMKEERMKRI